MKHKMYKVLTSLMLAMLICMSCVSVAFAEEFTKESDVGSTISTRASSGEYDMQNISAKGTVTLYPTLNSYFGPLTRTFYFSADNIYSDVIPSGTVQFWVYDPDGEFMFGGIVNVGQEFRKSVFLPSSGRYTVIVESNVNAKLLVSALWEA